MAQRWVLACPVLDLDLTVALEIQSCNDVSRIRLVCMGSGMLKDNTSLGMSFHFSNLHFVPQVRSFQSFRITQLPSMSQFGQRLPSLELKPRIPSKLDQPMTLRRP